MLRSFVLTAGLGLAALASAQTPPSPPADPAAAEPASAAAVAVPQVVLHTNLGEITIELFADKAPKSVENFLQYVRDGHYNGTIFHRVIDGFMVQGGGYTVDLQLKPTRDPIENEARNGLSNQRGTLAMARTNDPHSARAQFFINVVDNPRLDFVSEQSPFTWGYAVFARVVDGMDVVDKIRALETGPQGPLSRDVPIQPAIIDSAEIVQPAAAAAADAAPTDAVEPAPGR